MRSFTLPIIALLSLSLAAASCIPSAGVDPTELDAGPDVVDGPDTNVDTGADAGPSDLPGEGGPCIPAIGCAEQEQICEECFTSADCTGPLGCCTTDNVCGIDGAGVTCLQGLSKVNPRSIPRQHLGPTRAAYVVEQHRDQRASEVVGGHGGAFGIDDPAVGEGVHGVDDQAGA